MKSKPKGLKGIFKQTEGSTPKSAMPAAKRAGSSKAREKRLMKEKM